MKSKLHKLLGVEMNLFFPMQTVGSFKNMTFSFFLGEMLGIKQAEKEGNTFVEALG